MRDEILTVIRKATEKVETEKSVFRFGLCLDDLAFDERPTFESYLRVSLHWIELIASLKSKRVRSVSIEQPYDKKPWLVNLVIETE